MSLITFPSPDCVTDFSLVSHANQRAFASLFGGSEQVVDMLNDRWHASLTLPPANGVDSARFEAFIAALRGQVNHTELHHFGRPVPLGTLSSSQGLIYDAAQGSDSITIATTAGATLLAGDMLGVDGLLLQCRADCTANADGVLVVPLVNRLRRAITGLRRASTATYVDGSGVLQTAAVDVPRFQGGALLVEGAAENQLTNSSNLSSFTRTGGSTTSASDPAFSGGGITFLEDASNGLHRLAVGFNVTGQVTLSVTARAAGRSSVVIGNATDSQVVTFSLTNGAASGAINGAVGVSSLIAADIWRLSVTFNPAVAGGKTLHIALSNGATTSYAGNTALGIVCGDVQIESGAAATSYIPTAATTATRSADIITPVVWDRPTAPFRLVGRPALRYVPGYSEGLSLDFVEKVD